MADQGKPDSSKSSSNRLFKELTRLFRSNPIVKKKIRSTDTVVMEPDRARSNGFLLFQRSQTPTYASLTNPAYNMAERLMRYEDYVNMEQMPEINSALDVWADESVAADENGRILHIFSENEKIKQELEELFYNIINTEFNLRPWIRNLVKYGDLFVFIDVTPNHGVLNAIPIPVNEIEREENFDKNQPWAVRFKFNSQNRTLENWEIAHFRLLGNDMFLPYGASVIEGARRIWRQLILAEDAMLVYRVTRAPERRVFYYDVGNMDPAEVTLYMEEQRKIMRTNSIVDPASGRVDLRYNPFSVDEDYFIARRNKDSGTEITTLAGGQNIAAIEDVAYLQKKLFSALKIPRAYLGYDESLSSKAGLAQLDIRFSRSVATIQKTIIAELNKIAQVHLFARGYSGDELADFTLHLSNPSTIAQQQKLEVMRTKMEIAGTTPENLVSKHWLRTQVLGLTEKEVENLDDQLYNEKIIAATIESLTVGDSGAEGGDFGGSGEGGGDEGGEEGLTPDLGGGGEEPAGEEPGGETGPAPENASDEPEEDVDPDLQLLTSADDPEYPSVRMNVDQKRPVNVSKTLDRVKYNRSRIRHNGASKTHMPDLNKMTGTNSREMQDPFDSAGLRAATSNPFGESRKAINIGLSPDLASALKAFGKKMDSQRKLLSENNDISDESQLFTLVDDKDSNDE